MEFRSIANLKEPRTMNNNYTQLSKIALPLLLLGITASVALAQDPFSSLGTSAQTISTGTFATGLIELAIVVGGLLLAFSGRVLGGLLIAIIGGGMMALSATKWMSWIQGL
jgi:TrbC/VIRB2 pilin